MFAVNTWECKKSMKAATKATCFPVVTDKPSFGTLPLLTLETILLLRAPKRYLKYR